MSRAAAQVHRQARHQLSNDRHSPRHPPSAFNQSLLLHDTRHPAPAPVLTTKPVRRTSLPPSLDTVRELASPDRRLVEPPMELEPQQQQQQQQISARRFSFRALFRSRSKAATPRRPDGDEPTAAEMLHQVSEEEDREPHSLEWLVYRFQPSRSSASLSGTTSTADHTADPTFAPTEGAFTPYQYQKYSLAWHQSQHRKKSRVQPNTGGSVSLTDLLTPQRLGRNSSTHSLPLTPAAAARGRPRSLSSVQQSRSRRESAVTFDTTTTNRPASIRSVRFAEAEGPEVIPRAPSLLHNTLSIDADPPPTPRSILRFSGLSSPPLVPEVTVEDTAVGSDASPSSLELAAAPSSEGRSSIDSTRHPFITRSIESTLSLTDINVAPRRCRSSSQSSTTRPKLARPDISISTSGSSQAPAKPSKSSPLGSSTSLMPDQASIVVSSPTSSLASLPPAPPPYQKLSRKVSPGSTASIASSTDRHNSPPSSWSIRNASTTTLLSPLQGMSLPAIPAPSSWGPIKRIRRGSSTSVDTKKSLGVKLASIEKGVHSSKFIRLPKEKPDPKTWGPRPVRGTYDFARGPGEAKWFEERKGQRQGAAEQEASPPRPTSARSLYVYDWTRDVTESVPWQRDNASTYSLPVFSSPWASDEPSPTDTVVDLPFLDKELPPLPTNNDGSETERSASPALSDCSLHRNLSLPKPSLPEVPEYITKHERRLAKMAERAERRLSVQVAVHSRERQSRSSAKGRGSTRRTLSAPPISDAA
ncbi:uncharacterized protein LOC62_06G008063 [Vanrija pseudolonga]|uniref:Uncharacterized protein n=1 Tax=Vanrija pseudolonga TaxID=143232 RepID=A0AAF0YDS8_9TREE|nr:hypothetical protein LOC62_06G008063 [Vanrija pseudolonga]